jgi:hypothetical protein
MTGTKSVEKIVDRAISSWFGATAWVLFWKSKQNQTEYLKKLKKSIKKSIKSALKKHSKHHFMKHMKHSI